MKYGYLLFLLTAFNFLVLGQTRPVIQGTIMDSTTNQPVPGVMIFVKDFNVSAMTDSAGHFRLICPERGVITLKTLHIGYMDHTVTIDLSNADNLQKQIRLRPGLRNLSEVHSNPFEYP